MIIWVPEILGEFYHPRGGTVYQVACPIDWDKSKGPQIRDLQVQIKGLRYEIVGEESWAMLKILKGTIIGIAVKRVS